MATGILVPGRLVSQPQFVAPIAPELRKYSPAIVVLPAALRNLASNQTVSLANDAVRKNGNFYFPGVDGYVDLGSDAIIGTTNFSFVVVSKLDAFVNSFPTILGVKNTAGTNLMAFYSNSAAYTDVTIGYGGIGSPYSLSQFGSVTGTWHRFVFVNNGGTSKLWCSGVQLTAKTAQSLGPSSGNSCLGQLNPANLTTDLNGSIATFALFNGVLPDAIAQSLSASPWQLFQAPPRRIWVSFAGVGGTTYLQSLSGSITATGALSKQTNKALAGSSTPAGALAKLTSKAFAGSLTSTGGLVKQTAKSYAGSITPSGALATMILFTAALAGSITPSGALSKMTKKALAGASTITGAITKMTGKGLAGSITMAGALNKLTKKAFAGSVTATGALAESYQVLKSLAGSIKPTGALSTAYTAFVAGVRKLLALMGIGQ